MHLKFRNVNDAFRGVVAGFSDGSYEATRRPSRNGWTLTIPEPVLITYEKPLERVLFNQARDASPWLHVYEALWMLAGRNDVDPLAYYAKQMREYSDDGKTLNGAYGYRWRQAKTYYEYGSGVQEKFGQNENDQLDVIAAHLKADPHSRRAVLQMWNVEDDLLKIGWVEQEMGVNHVRKIPKSKDVCCNLSVMFAVREEQWRNAEAEHHMAMPVRGTRQVLDMTVTNRSNDMVWGMLGANYVHFTFLQEYMAARIGCEVGRYSHFTNNLHVYDEPDNPKVPKWEPDKWLAEYKPMDYVDYRDPYPPGNVGHAYAGPQWRTVPLVRDPAVFERELPLFVEFHGSEEVRGDGPAQRWEEPFLQDVAQPLLDTFHFHKLGDRELALECAASVKANDWRIAATNWLQRRKK